GQSESWRHHWRDFPSWLPGELGTTQSGWPGVKVAEYGFSQWSHRTSPDPAEATHTSTSRPAPPPTPSRDRTTCQCSPAYSCLAGSDSAGVFVRREIQVLARARRFQGGRASALRSGGAAKFFRLLQATTTRTLGISSGRGRT